MNMKTKFGQLLIYVDYDSGECFMKRNEVWFMCIKKKKKIPEEKKLTNDSNIKNTTATKKHKHEINMNLDP